MDEVAELVGRICTDHAGDPERTWAALAQAGLVRVGFAESAGGDGGNLQDGLTVAGALAEHAVSTPAPEQALLAGWLAERTKLRLPDGVIAVAHAGPAVAPAGAATVAGVAWARAASHLLLVTTASTEDEAAIALIPAGDFRVTPRANLAGEPRDDVHIDLDHPPAARLPRAVCDELQLRAALLRSVQISAALRRVLTLTLRYSSERVQFGRRLAQLDPVRQQVAEFAGEAAAAANATTAAIAALAEHGPAATIPVAAAKVQAGRAATIGARIAHQVHGAIGVTREHPLHRHTIRLWAWRDEFGAEEYWAQRIADAVTAASVERDPWPVLAGL